MLVWGSVGMLTKALQHPFLRTSLNDVCSPTRIEDLLLFGKDVEDF